MQSFNRYLSSFSSYGPLVIRVVLGVLFVLHGFDKFSVGISNIVDFFEASGVPMPGLTAPFVGVAEIVLGLALIVGLATRLAALVLAGIIVGALIWVKNDAVLGRAELDLAYLAGLLALVVLGPGRLSMDGALGQDSGDVGVGSTIAIG